MELVSDTEAATDADTSLGEEKNCDEASDVEEESGSSEDEEEWELFETIEIWEEEAGESSDDEASSGDG